MARPVIDGCHATGRIKRLNLYTLSVVILTLPLSWIAFKIGYPPQTIFIIYGILLCLNNIVELVVLKLEISFNIGEYLVGVMGRCFLVTILVVIIPLLIRLIIEPSFNRLCISVLSCIICVGLGVYLFILDKNKRKTVVSYVLNIVRKATHKR